MIDSEEEARAYAERIVPDPSGLRALERFADMLRVESRVQNLIAASTMDRLWQRHIADSLQLLPLVDGRQAVDIGSGAGFPGLVLAIAGLDISLVEPRRKRAEWLSHVVERLDLPGIQVQQVVMAKAVGRFEAITARAVCAPSDLFEGAAHLASSTSRWILPRGLDAVSQCVQLQLRWSGSFHVERSVTNTESSIIVVDHLRTRRAA